MKFIIKNISKNSGRLGQLVQAEGAKQFRLKTPLLLQTTKRGSIPYISREVFDYISKDVHLLQMSMATMEDMSESLKQFEGGLSAYVGYNESPTMMLVRDPCDKVRSGHNDKDVVPLYTRRGKETVTAKKYMDMMESFAPDIYQGLCDADTDMASAKKRVQKSVDRTEKFMNHCYERHCSSEQLKTAALFAPVVGGYNTYARSESIKHAQANSDSWNGYVLEGFHHYGLSATTVDEDQVMVVLTHCLKEMVSDRPKMMPGAYTPLLVLELVRVGVDMFDTSYAYCAAVNHNALTFNFELSDKLSDENVTDSPMIDLTDESLKDDFRPLLNACGCLTCTKHTRAYLHHLYQTKELLGPILLMIHNLHHYVHFFEAIRACVHADTLPALIERVRYQSTDTPIDYRIHANTKKILRGGLGKEFITPITAAKSATRPTNARPC